MLSEEGGGGGGGGGVVVWCGGLNRLVYAGAKGGGEILLEYQWPYVDNAVSVERWVLVLTEWLSGSLWADGPADRACPCPGRACRAGSEGAGVYPSLSSQWLAWTHGHMPAISRPWKACLMCVCVWCVCVLNTPTHTDSALTNAVRDIALWCAYFGVAGLSKVMICVGDARHTL